MSARSSNKKTSFRIHKQGRLTMPRLKYGKISHTIANLTYGPWAVCCMSCVLWFHLFVLKTCKVFTKKLSRASTRASPTTSAKKWQRSLSSCWMSTRTIGPTATNYSHCQLWKLSPKSSTETQQTTAVTKWTKTLSRRSSSFLAQ